VTQNDELQLQQLQKAELRSMRARYAANKRWAKATPEQKFENSRNASNARWSALTPEQRSEWRTKRDRRARAKRRKLEAALGI